MGSKLSSSTLEDLNSRYPYITEQIFGYLDIRSLAKCREVCKSWCSIIDNKKFTWIRMVKKIGEQFFSGPNLDELLGLWSKILQKSSMETVKELANTARYFYKFCPSRDGQTPLHFTVRSGFRTNEYF